MPKRPSDSTADAGPADESAPSAASGHGDDELAQLDFEAALEELEALVDQMETGDLSLEASLAAYERGVRLTRHCQAALKKAELKVSRLTAEDELEPMDPDDLDDD